MFLERGIPPRCYCWDFFLTYSSYWRCRLTVSTQMILWLEGLLPVHNVLFVPPLIISLLLLAVVTQGPMWDDILRGCLSRKFWITQHLLHQVTLSDSQDSDLKTGLGLAGGVTSIRREQVHTWMQKRTLHLPIEKKRFVLGFLWLWRSLFSHHRSKLTLQYFEEKHRLRHCLWWHFNPKRLVIWGVFSCSLSANVPLDAAVSHTLLPY